MYPMLMFAWAIRSCGYAIKEWTRYSGRAGDDSNKVHSEVSSAPQSHERPAFVLVHTESSEGIAKLKVLHNLPLVLLQLVGLRLQEKLMTYRMVSVILGMGSRRQPTVTLTNLTA